MKTPFPAARPSTLTTQGGRATASASAVGTPATAITSLAKLFEPSIRAAARPGPKTAIPLRRNASPHPRDERRLRPDHREVDVEAAGEAQQHLGVVRPHGMTVAERRDPGIPGRGVQNWSDRAPAPSVRASACSRPPDPTRSTFTAAESTPPEFRADPSRAHPPRTRRGPGPQVASRGCSPRASCCSSSSCSAPLSSSPARRRGCATSSGSPSSGPSHRCWSSSRSPPSISTRVWGARSVPRFLRAGSSGSRATATRGSSRASATSVGR